MLRVCPLLVVVCVLLTFFVCLPSFCVARRKCLAAEMLAHLRSVGKSSVLPSRHVSVVVSGRCISACVRTSVKKSGSIAVRRLSVGAARKACACPCVSGVCAVHGSVHASVSLLGRASRRYMSAGASGAGGENKESSESGAKAASAGVGESAVGKKVGGTSSTLSNLENLYAAFAKQQKEKAKAAEQKEVEKDAAKRPLQGVRPRESPSGTMQDVHRRAALSMETYGRGSAAPSFFESLRPDDLFADGATVNFPQQGLNLHEKGKKSTYNDARVQEQKEALNEMKSLVSQFDGSSSSASDDTYSAKKRAPRTLAELRAQDEELAIAEGRLDPMSPQALQMKKRNQPIVPRSENEAMMIETTLINRHRAAVEQVAHVEKELDISATVPGMAPLTHSQNPYLYNEAFQLGLTDAEITWLKTRENWNNLVIGKRTSLALQQRDMKEDRQLVDELFIKVVNRLSEGPQSGTWIHPEDLKAQQKALEARQRLKDKMWDIYRHNPVQWAALVHKYVPKVVEDKLATHVMDPLFWSPTNPWLLTAFTKQLIDEARILEKTTGSQPIEEEIQQRLIDQGQLRDDDVSDSMEIGPLGQSMGVSAEEEAEQREEEALANQNLGCLFCSVHRHRFPLEPMNVPLLARHMTSSGQILPRTATGLCKRHQAKMAKTIKQARHLNLFIYKRSEYRINNIFKPASQWSSPDLDQVIYTDPLLNIEQKDSEEPEMDAFISKVTKANSEEEEDAMQYAADMRISPSYATTRREARTVGMDYEAFVEELNAEPADPAVMSSIETLASKRTESRARQDQELAESEAAFNKVSKESRRDATSSFQKGNLSARYANGNIDSFDEKNDQIGDSMVKSAVNKATRGTARASQSTRKMKDSL